MKQQMVDSRLSNTSNYFVNSLKSAGGRNPNLLWLNRNFDGYNRAIFITVDFLKKVNWN